jgi:hypothetical protein
MEHPMSQYAMRPLVHIEQRSDSAYGLGGDYRSVFGAWQPWYGQRHSVLLVFQHNR